MNGKKSLYMKAATIQMGNEKAERNQVEGTRMVSIERIGEVTKPCIRPQNE